MALLTCLLDPQKLPEHKKRIDILSPITGKTENLDSSNEASFKHRMFGEGALITPSGYYVTAPFDGVIEDIPYTANRIRLRDKHGLRIQIQCGFGSYKLYGNGFKTSIKKGQRVVKGDVLLEFDIRKLKRLLEDPRFAVTLLNSDKTKGLLFSSKQVTANEDTLFSIIL